MKQIIIAAVLLAVSCTSSPEVYDPIRGEGQYILTPEVAAEPRVMGAHQVGVRPGAELFFPVSVAGDMPINVDVEGLPEGLDIDVSNGVIFGTIADLTPRTYEVLITARNSKGSSSRPLDIVVGEKIQLAPPMGWSSWIATKPQVSARAVLDNAKQLNIRGLQQLGYHYVNIDDKWQGPSRAGKFHAIMPDSTYFPDLQALIDRVHNMGMKFGLYSTPWVTSYAKRIGGSSNRVSGDWSEADIISHKNLNVEGRASLLGRYRFDDNDAKQWAEWGVDYMKYDWNPCDSASIVSMATALRNSGREIVFSISNSCPTSEGIRCRDYVQVFRTGGDIRARWDEDGSHLNLRENWDNHNNWIEQAYEGGVGHTPDPDFLMVGLQRYDSKRDLTADELYHHVSSYVLWGAPLLLSCDLSKLNPFEMSLLTNVEMLDIDQDKLSLPGRIRKVEDGVEIMVKELADGEKAIGIFNFNGEDRTATLDWQSAGLQGSKILRDVWRQSDIGRYKDSFSCVVPAHGVVVVRTR